jgi:hypothetical protein
MRLRYEGGKRERTEEGGYRREGRWIPSKTMSPHLNVLRKILSHKMQNAIKV